ncbi:MAG: FAD-dependent oxidoreductase [Armatimonadota bacterium]
MTQETIRETARELPVVGEVDVLVCGGGPAGTAAAVAAARAGAKTMLLERYGCLGGLATGGLVIVLPPLVRGEHQVIGGIGQETLDRLLEAGEAEYRSERGSSRFDPEGLKRLSDEMCLDAGVLLRLHSWAVGVFGEEGRPEGVIVESKAGREAIRAGVIVDCTGDGDVAARAGAGYERDDKMIGLPFRIGNIDLERWGEARGDGTGKRIHKEAHEAAGYESHFGLSPFPLNPGVAWGNNHMASGDFLDPDVLTRMEVRGRRSAKVVLDVMREKMPGFEESWLIDTASQIGVRCTRRITGLATMRYEEFEAERQFDDSVALGNDFRRPDVVYEIPLGSLIPADVGGVLVAGRCVSGDAEAMEALREIHCCWTMGEAAGAAAALAIEQACEPRDVPVGALRESLVGAGAVVDLPPRSD